MGKIEVSQLPSLASGSHRQRKRATHVTAAATVIFLLWTWWAICREDSTAELGVAPASAATSNNELTTDWNLIEPSEDLHWVPCFRATDEFYCSRLTVPLDYNRPLHSSSTLLRPSPKVHIALVMLPGRNHSESGAWSESPLLVNPGGPGGSGTTLVLLAGRAHQEVAGADLDIIGFDPRGIGATTPKADCFSDMSGEAQAGPPQPGSLLRRVLWMSENAVVGLPNTSSTATEQVVFRQRGLTRLCNPQDYPDSILRYAGTPNVATDMLSIVQAWEKWTASLPQGSGLAREDGHAVDVGEVASPETAQPDPAKNETPPPSTRGKLVYWGFSYGTVLGATFATMFPDYVGRMVLDGVVNSDEWYFENSWINAVQDTDKVIDYFQLYCFQAQERCHLYRKGDQLTDLKARFAAVFQDLAEHPRVYAIKGSMPVYVTYSAIKSLLFSIAYVPTLFPVAAAVLDGLHRGLDLSSFLHWQPIDMTPLCDSRFEDVRIKSPDDGGLAVMCSDQRFMLNTTRSALDEELRKMTEVSSFGDVSFTIASRCVGWDIDHVEPPAMDWHRFPLKDRDPVNTSFPILFVSNTHDPVTPLRSGLEQSRKFVDAGFIEQKGEGHCSSAMVSLCTMTKIQAYLSKGIVPDKPSFDDSMATQGGLTGKWTTCEVDQRPWGVPGPHSLASRGGFTAEEVGLLQAGANLQHTFKNRLHFLPRPPGFEKLFEMEDAELEELLATANAQRMGGA